MVAVPAATPVTNPCVPKEVTVALALLLQVPPPVDSVSVTTCPVQTDVVPVIACTGLAVTLTCLVA